MCGVAQEAMVATMTAMGHAKLLLEPCTPSGGCTLHMVCSGQGVGELGAGELNYHLLS